MKRPMGLSTVSNRVVREQAEGVGRNQIMEDFATVLRILIFFNSKQRATTETFKQIWDML